MNDKTYKLNIKMLDVNDYIVAEEEGEVTKEMFFAIK